MDGVKNQVKVVALPPLRQRARSLLVVVFLALLLVALSFVLLEITVSRAAPGELFVEIIAAYNLVVDSNVESPSTYAPSVATVAGRFCNIGDEDLTDVHGYIGNYVNGTNDTPGIYPARTVDAAFTATHPALTNAPGSSYSFTHVGGRLGTADATRFIGTLASGECSVQYWHFTYPQCELNPDGSVDLPECETGNSPTWGDSVKPYDDLWLEFDIWGTAFDGTSTQIADETRTMTMRNEISAMANKIKPNPDGQWFNTEGNEVVAGGVITSNGILYTFGNVRHGFDNNGDYVPDYNAWAQPIGDPSYDPSCFRLIRTSGVLTVTRPGDDLIIPFDDQDLSLSEPYGGPLYFTNLPSDNTEVKGEVFYTFLALDGPCSTSMTPYQEVASGYDNEKFNGDYGVGIPPIGSSEPLVTLDKASDPTVIPLGQTTTYQIPFANGSSTTDFGLGLSSGTGMGMMISDTVPVGTVYVADSATATLSYTGSVTIRYSTDSGQTWILTDPGDTRSSSGGSLVIIQWWLDDPLPAGSSGNYAEFQVLAPSDSLPPAYSGSYIENCAEASLGDGAPFAEACTITLIDGDNSIGDFVWRDENNDGLQTGETTNGISNVTVWLYLDKDGDGELDSSDRLISTTVTSGTGNNYLFDDLPDGDYLVKVDVNDGSIPTGYRRTTPEVHAVTGLSNTTAYLNADFGFGPSLAMEKRMLSAGDTCDGYEGGEVVYSISLTNERPGTGETVGSDCRYSVWSSTGSTANPPKNFTDDYRAYGTPDGSYAYGDFAIGGNRWIEGTSFDPGGTSGTISSVEAVFRVYLDSSLTDDQVTARLYYGATELNNVFSTARLNNFVGVQNAGYITWTIPGASAPGGSWDWSDFASLTLRIEPTKNTNDDGSLLYIDAIGFRVIASGACPATDDDDIMTTVPLTDTYDTTYLQFISADPAHTAVNTTTGVITWTNVGPIYPGETRNVYVHFLAKAIAGTSSVTVINSAASTGAKFADGDSVNNVYDTASGSICQAGSINGYVYSDPNSSGWNYNPGGGDLPISGVQVTLYGCYHTEGDYEGELITLARSHNSVCTSSQNDGEWRQVAPTVTDANGYYAFNGLFDGFYYVQVTTATLPGTVNQTAEADDAQTVTGTLPDTTANGGSGNNSIWGDPTTGKLGTTEFNPINSPSETINGVNFGYTIQAGAYGSVWEDNNGDGDKDDGEGPISSVTVGLYTGSCGGTLVVTTTTDADGRYQFGNLTAGTTYYIAVYTNTLPGGASAWTQTGESDTSINNCISFIAVAGTLSGSHDFGFRNVGSYTVGDTLYYDWNGDGAQQSSSEEGIPNVTVYLYEDSNGNGAIDLGEDAIIMTATTTIAGFYQFANLPADEYLVVVDTTDPDFPAAVVQTQDPDEDPGVCTTCDSRGMSVLSSTLTSDLTVDFGYRPIGAGAIGDFVWRDDDGDGVQDAGEPGIPDILVTLYEDDNNNGVIDSGDAVVITATTGVSGTYLFTGLPAGDYLVDVDTEDSDLPEDDNFDPYVLTTDNDPHDVTLSTGEEYLDADFGFTTGGIIGDTVYQDTDADGQQDIGEPGISGVTVELYQDTDENGTYETWVDTQVTDSGGIYEFSGLPSGYYRVIVDMGTLPAGSTQTGDPDLTGPCSGPTCDSQSDPYLYPGQVDRSRDFGYRPLGLIGDTLWIDTDDDGTRDEDESGIPYVTVTLYDDVNANGIYDPVTDTLRATTETNSEGYYYFGGMPVPEYYVVVVDTNDTDFPTGLDQTYDPDGTLDDQSGAALIGGNYTDLTRDFGYQYDGNWDISGYVFYDFDNDGGIYTSTVDIPYSGIPVYLRNSSGLLIGTTTTNSSGYYEFTGLPNGDYIVAVDEIPDLISQTMTYEPDGTGGDGLCEEGDPCNNNAVPVTISNADKTHQDFGYYGDPPTAVTLSFFKAEWQDGKVVVAWETAMEIDTVGFNLWRSTSPNGTYERVNDRLIPAASLGGVWGGFYSYTDTDVFAGRAYYYKLEELEVGGKRNWYGPVSTGDDVPTSVAFFNVAASGGAVGIWWLAGAVAMLSLPPLLVRLWRRRR